MLIDKDIFEQYIYIAQNINITPSFYELSKLCKYHKRVFCEDNYCSLFKDKCLCENCTLLKEVHFNFQTKT